MSENNLNFTSDFLSSNDLEFFKQSAEIKELNSDAYNGENVEFVFDYKFDSDAYNDENVQITFGNSFDLDFLSGENVQITFGDQFNFDFFSGQNVQITFGDQFDFDFFSGQNVQITFGNSFDSDAYNDENVQITFGDQFDFDFFSDQNVQITFGDQFDFDFFSGQNFRSEMYDQFYFDFYDNNYFQLTIGPNQASNNLNFTNKFKKSNDLEFNISSFYFDIHHGENLQFAFDDQFNFDFLVGQETIFDLEIEKSSCSQNSLSIALQGLVPLNSNQEYSIALQGFLLQCLLFEDPIDFLSGENVQITFGDQFDFDFLSGENVQITFGNSFDLDFLSGENVQITFGDQFNFDFSTGENLQITFGDQFNFDFLSGQNNSFDLEIKKSSCSQNSLSIALQGLVPLDSNQEYSIALQGFLLQCLLFEDPIDFLSGENLQFAFDDRLNFDFFSGQETIFDLEIKKSSCSLNALKIAQQGITSSPGIVAAQGFVVICQEIDQINFDFLTGENLQFAFDDQFNFDFFSGQNSLIDIQSNTNFEILFSSGTQLHYNLDIYPVYHGGSDLEVIDISDSRRIVTIRVSINNIVSQCSIKIEMIKMNNIFITSQPQINIEKKNISIHVSCLNSKKEKVTISCNPSINLYK